MNKNYPFNKPAPLLRDVLPKIEAMLAPVSDRRQMAYELGKKTLRQEKETPCQSTPATKP